MADRFLEVLMRRPRPGTALDRVYGYHVQNGSLEELITSLEVDDDAENVGASTMILGLIQSQRGKPALAVRALEKAERLLPNDAACSYYLGKAMLAIGQTESAADAIARSIERKPARNEALPIFTELGRIYGRAGQSEKALAVWKQLEAMFPGDARVGGQIAQTLAEEGNVQEALDRYAKLSESTRDEEDKIAFAVRAAEMRRRLGENDEATKELEHILTRLRPGSWLYTDVRNRIEDGFLKSGDYDALADYYIKQLAESPDNLELQTRLGRILVSAGRLDEAKETLQKAAQRAPDDANVRLALIDVLVGKGDIAEAAKQYEALAEQDPENPDYLLRWGSILLEDKQSELAARRVAAAKVWQRLADARTDDAVTLSQIADRLRGIDQKEDSIKLYREAIEVDPKSPQYREYLGEYLYELDRKDEAVEVWESIAADDRRDRDSLVRLAEVFGTFNLNDRAIESWREAAKLDLAFAQELRFAKKLSDAKLHDEALQRLDVAEKISETPDEHEQLLKERIATYQEAGKLSEQIASLQAEEPSATNLRKLALMHQAAGQLTDAGAVIRKAITAEPENIDVLIVAADISERQNRFSDAVDLFHDLAKIDTRFRTNYLQRIADLQMRLGQIDEALQTCESLIDANPASPESYQFYARTAFRANREDQAVTALRRAMNVAPRDNSPRRMLASSFGEQYRTDEAIELYWQAMQYESKSDDRIALIRLLAPLYDRKTETEVLIQRIEELGREAGDSRVTQLMISAAHEAVEDYGAARKPIDRLLAEQPRDVTLLEAMVRLSDLADEVTVAAEFQERIVALADTPENRYKMVQLKLDAGMIDVTAALSERISLASDPTRLGAMIRSAASRGDTQTAIKICREALQRDPSLWDIKLTLAQMLLQTDGDDQAQLHEESAKLCREIRDLNIAFDAKPPTAKQIKSQNRNLPAGYLTNPMYWTRSNYELARTFRLGQYANANYGYSYSGGSTAIAPSSFGHARVLAASLLITHSALEKTGKELNESVDQLTKKEFPLPAVDEITDPHVIWENRAVKSFASMVKMSPSQRISAVEVSDEEKALQEALTWRLAELDPTNGASSLISTLAVRIERPDDSADAAKKTKEEVDRSPLTQKQLDVLARLFEQAKTRTDKSAQSQPGMILYHSVLTNEFTLAGQPDKAEQYQMPTPPEDASLADLLATIAFYLGSDEVDKADALVERLMPAVRQSTFNKSPTGPSVTGSVAGFSRQSKAGRDFVERHRIPLLDAVLAAAIAKTSSSRNRNSAPTNGTVQTYYLSTQNSYRSIQIKAPLSSNLMSQPVVAELAGLLSQKDKKVSGGDMTLIVPKAIIDHLRTPLAGASPQETKSRQVLAAFAHWWDKRPSQCYQELIELCEQYPDDVDLQIERARLASELQQPRVALDALDSFDPLDSRMLVRKEMAAMNLAAKLGDLDRAKQAGERLFGMRMDTNTQLALADQLRRMGMEQKSAAVLRRMRGGKSRTESTEIQIAQAFLASEDKDSAAEVAYTLLRRMGSGRRGNNNQEYYRQQAVSILKSAGRMKPLIERAERRVKSAPSSTRARIELSELYTAAGRAEDADKLWAEIAADRPNDPRQLLARASALSRAKRHKEAMMLYLDAFEKQPQLFSNNYYDMTRAAQQAKAEDEMFERLLEFKPESIPGFRIDELVRVGGSRDFSEAKLKFVSHALKNSYARTNFYSIIDSIPDEQAAKVPEIREVMVESVCSPVAFTPASPTWQVRSRSSGGFANGPLASLVDLISTDEEVAKKFLQAAKDATEEESSKPTADFLVALVKIKNGVEKEQSVETLRSLIPKQLNEETSTTIISGGLLWQAGQVLEKTDGIKDRPAMLIAIYESALLDSNVSRNDFRYSASARLVDALIKNERTSEARQYILEAYKAIDHSDQNQYNPGYGDYQELSEYRSLAEKLVSMGSPIDALAIYRRALAQPEKFENAKRWSSSTSLQRYKDGAKTAAEKVTPKIASDYLINISQEMMESDQTPAIDLLDLPLDSLLSGEMKPGLSLAIETAMQSDKGIDAIKAFGESLAELADKNASDWSIPAAQVLVATQADAENVSTLVEVMMKRLPDIDAIKAVANQPTATKYSDLLDLYPVVVAALSSDNPATKESGTELASYLKTVAKTINEPRLDLALANLTGDGNSLAEYLTTIEANLKPGVPLANEQVMTALGVARTAALDGNITTSTRALKIALGNGPPLRNMAVGGDAFAIASANSRSTRQQDDGGMGALIVKVNSLVDIYSKVTGQKMGATDSERIDGPIDVDSMKEIALALQAVVLPEHRSANCFPYAKPIASTSGYDSSSRPTIIPESLSIAMVRASKLAGRSDQLLETIQTRLPKAADMPTSAGVLVEAAVATNDPDVLSDALATFATAMDSKLPKTGSPVDLSSRTITSQMQQDSYRKSKILNIALQAIWPVIESSELDSEEVNKQAFSLLERTSHLIGSDYYTSNRHRGIASQVRRKILIAAAKSNDNDLIQTVLKAESDTIEQRYSSSGYDEERANEYKKRAYESLLSEWLKEGLLPSITANIRNLMLLDQKVGTNFQSQMPAGICLEISQLPKEQQLDLLMQITLGEKDDGPVANWGSFVRYTNPPPMLRRQTPSLAAIHALPTCDPQMPITDTILLLADLAAELDRSDEVAELIARRSSAAGDNADIAAALVRMAAFMKEPATAPSANTLKSLDTTYAAIAKYLASNKPQKTDSKLKYPALAAYLATRAIRAGLPQAQASKLMQDLKPYSVRSNRNMMTSAIGRVIAQIGVGRAANATETSPLEHFVPVALPARYSPSTESLNPLYAIDGAGWISGTSGNNTTLLMLRYPLAGTFNLTADIFDGGWGEADLSYGGVLYQANGWNSRGQVTSLLGKTADFSVPKITRGALNSEGIQVTSDAVIAACNGVDYVTDLKVDSYPWFAVTHHMYRTTRFNNIKISGEPTIPREVNLLASTMRGWSYPGSGVSLPDPLLPIGPKQDADKIKVDRKKSAETFKFKWRMIDDELKFTSDENDGGESHIQYLRPLFDGESVEISFWWEKGTTAIHPAIGRTVLQLSPSGTRPKWTTITNDLTRRSYVEADKLEPPMEPLATENLPLDKAWNTIKMTLVGDHVAVTLNEKPLVEIPVSDAPRPGLVCPKGHEARVRAMKLTGDWPEKLPEDLMSKSKQ
ncbi:MAG: tetratricopeptide repeat protein [Rubripirellula sp.]